MALTGVFVAHGEELLVGHLLPRARADSAIVVFARLFAVGLAAEALGLFG